MDEKDAIKAAKMLFGSFGSAGRSGRATSFNRPYVTDGVGRTWVADTWEEALALAERDAHPTVAHRVARKAFAARGNPTLIRIAEHELVSIITEAL